MDLTRARGRSRTAARSKGYRPITVTLAATTTALRSQKRERIVDSSAILLPEELCSRPKIRSVRTALEMDESLFKECVLCEVILRLTSQ